MLTDDLRALGTVAADAREAIDRASRLAVAVLTPGADEFAKSCAREFLEQHAPDQIPTSRAKGDRA